MKSRYLECDGKKKVVLLSSTNTLYEEISKMANVEMNLRAATQAIEGQAKIFGPVFPRLAAQSWVRFVAEKIGETPPNVDSMEQALDYVRAKTEKYPGAYTGLAYAICKATAMLEGHLGVGTSSLAKNAENHQDWSNNLRRMIGTTAGTTDAINKYLKGMETLGIYTPGMIVSSGSETDSTLSFHNCEYTDVCDRIWKEGIERRKGEKECYFGVTITTALGMITSKQHDFKSVRITPPNCEVKIYQIQ